MLSFRVFAARPPRRSPDSISNLAPISHPLSPNSFHCHRSEKTPVNSNHCHTSKIAACNPCVCHTSEPPRGLTLDVPTSKHLGVPNLQTCQQSNVPTIYPLSFHILANSFACFCICAKVNPFRFKRFRTLYQKHGVGILPTFQPSNLQTFPRPIAAKLLWCHNPQRHAISLRSGETTPVPPVSKSTRADIGDSSILVPFASRAWVQRSKAGFRVCLTNPEQAGPQQGGLSNSTVQDGQLNRVGKAGSVRLG